MGEDAGGRGKGVNYVPLNGVVDSPQDRDMSAEMGKDLAAKMVKDNDFFLGVERGLRDKDEGRYSTIQEIKRRLRKILPSYIN